MPNSNDPCANCKYTYAAHFITISGGNKEYFCVVKSFISGKLIASHTKQFSPVVSPVAKTIPPIQNNFNYTNMCATCGKMWSAHYINSTPNLSCAPNGNQYFVLAAQTKPSITQPGDMFGNPCADDLYARDDIFTRKRIDKAIDTAKAMASDKPIDEEERLIKVLTGVRVGECACKMPRHQCSYHKD